MHINFEELLPEDVSDESAFHIANFMMDLALAVDSHYFAQLRRHCKNTGGIDTRTVVSRTLFKMR